MSIYLQLWTPFQTHSKFIILEIELVVITDYGNIEQLQGGLGGNLCHQILH